MNQKAQQMKSNISLMSHAPIKSGSVRLYKIRKSFKIVTQTNMVVSLIVQKKKRGRRGDGILDGIKNVKTLFY